MKAHGLGGSNSALIPRWYLRRLERGNNAHQHRMVLIAYEDAMDADDFKSMLDQARRDRENRAMHPKVHLQKICTDAVQYRVNDLLGEEDLNKRIGRSLYSYLLQEMTKAASDYAVTGIFIWIVSGVFPPSCSERHSSEDANLLMASVRIYGRPYS